MTDDHENELRPREAFTDDDMAELLAPPYGPHHYAEKLTLASRFMSAAADCMEPYNIWVIDPSGLLVRFEEVFLTSRRLVAEFSEEYEERIDNIESSLDLSQNVILLGTIARRRPPPSASGILTALTRAAARITPSVRLAFPNREVEQLSSPALLEIKTALNRLSGLISTAGALAQEWVRREDDVVVVNGFYDPRHVSKPGLKYVLHEAIRAISGADEVPVEAREVVLRELRGAVRDLDRGKTPWSRVLSRVTQVTMVLAALVTIAGGIDEASENLRTAYQRTRQAIEVIQDQSLIGAKYLVPNPSRALPSPDEPPKAEEAPDGVLSTDPDVDG